MFHGKIFGTLILRGFEVVLGLCVNFSKTKIYGVNLKEDFLSVAASFLSCDKGNIPFRFLGVSVGMKPRRKEAWCSIGDKLKKKTCILEIRLFVHEMKDFDVEIYSD